MGRSEELFEKITTQGEVAIEAFINDRQSEELHLDFKRSRDSAASGKLHRDDRENLATAISGFGNSDGGVIVWGVDCRNLPDAGDVATAKFPIENPKRFKSYLEGAVSACTLPAHPSVRHVDIEQAVGGKGFVATHIPLSYMAPHQNIYDNKYYMRAGLSFILVPHPVLSGMFGRRPQPVLAHKWFGETPRFEWGRTPGDPLLNFNARLILLNQGRGLARDLYVNVESSPSGPNSHLHLIQRPNDWKQEQPPGGGFSAIADESVRLGVNAQTSPIALSFVLAGPFNRPFELTVSYGCTDAPITVASCTAAPDGIRNLVMSKNVPSASALVALLLPRGS